MGTKAQAQLGATSLLKIPKPAVALRTTGARTPRMRDPARHAFHGSPSVENTAPPHPAPGSSRRRGWRPVPEHEPPRLGLPSPGCWGQDALPVRPPELAAGRFRRVLPLNRTHVTKRVLYPPFTGEETEAQRGERLPRVPRLARAEAAFLSRLSLESPVLDTCSTRHEAPNPSASRHGHGFSPAWGAVEGPRSSAAQKASLSRSGPDCGPLASGF